MLIVIHRSLSAGGPDHHPQLLKHLQLAVCDDDSSFVETVASFYALVMEDTDLPKYAFFLCA